jgi:ABC-2 type transport system ATP-binding protein
MDTAIKTTKLTKYYGSTRGIENLDLEIGKGEVLGYLGPNGAGKSTTIRHGHVLTVTVEGSVDALVKAAARFEVLTIRTHEPDLEEVFLSHYKDDSDAA